MNGSEKQIAYAETLRDNAIKTIKEQIVIVGNPDYYRNKTTDGKTIEQLEKRTRMIAEMETRIIEKNSIIEKLTNFVGYAGTMIDCCKMRWFEYSKTQVGYKNYLEM